MQEETLFWFPNNAPRHTNHSPSIIKMGQKLAFVVLLKAPFTTVLIRITFLWHHCRIEENPSSCVTLPDELAFNALDINIGISIGLPWQCFLSFEVAVVGFEELGHPRPSKRDGFGRFRLNQTTTTKIRRLVRDLVGVSELCEQSIRASTKTHVILTKCDTV